MDQYLSKNCSGPLSGTLYATVGQCFFSSSWGTVFANNTHWSLNMYSEAGCTSEGSMYITIIICNFFNSLFFQLFL